LDGFENHFFAIPPTGSAPLRAGQPTIVR
jgi:hypothetical protein